MSRDDSRVDEYADWQPPGQSEGSTDEREHEDDVRKPPSEIREPLFRDRVRDRLGVTPRQWYVIETLLLVLPYPVFVGVYLVFTVNDTAFLLVTLLYSLIATYVGFLS